jgi:hypothetical protein
MPRQKDLKRLVRARMKKTGEAYTTARSQILKKPKSRPTARLAAALSGAPKQDYAALAGMSDASIKAKTGCNWERRVKSLDYHGADKMAHGKIVELVKSRFGRNWIGIGGGWTISAESGSLVFKCHTETGGHMCVLQHGQVVRFDIMDGKNIHHNIVITDP